MTMTEIIESPSQFEKFNSDKERIEFLEKSIIDCIQRIKEKKREEFSQALELRIKETGINPDMQSGTKKKEATKLRKEMKYFETLNLAISNGLNLLRKDFENDPLLKDYIPEANVFIEAIRTMFLTERVIKYKEYQVMTDAPKLSDEEIKEQDDLREDMTESRALIQWYVLQNGSDPDYLSSLFEALRVSTGTLGFEKSWLGMERGLRQELGILKLLRKYFKKVVPGEPKEDAHYAIDFWTETNNGNTLIFQSKSSFAFLDEGVYDEKGISDLEKDLSVESPSSAAIYQKNYGVEIETSDLVKVRKLQQDIIKAKTYARSKKGVGNAPFYLIVSKSGNYEDITGKPILDMTKSIEKALWHIANLY